MHFWLERSIFHTHPHSSISTTTLIKIISSQRTGHMSVLKTALATRVQWNTSWFTSPDWNYPEKRECTFFGQRGDIWAVRRLCKLTKNTHLPKSWWSISTLHFWVRYSRKMFSGWTKNIFLERKKANHTHPPKPLILNNLSIVMMESRLQLGFGFSFCPFCKDTSHPTDSAQPQGCCCLPSYQVQEGISTLANSEQFPLKASAQHAILTLQALANASANNGGIFHQKSTLIKGRVKQCSQEAAPFLLIVIISNNWICVLFSCIPCFFFTALFSFCLVSGFQTNPLPLGKASLQSSFPQSFQFLMLYSASFCRLLPICTFPLHFKTAHHKDKGPSEPLHMQTVLAEKTMLVHYESLSLRF